MAGRRWQATALVSAAGLLAVAGCGSSSKGAAAPKASTGETPASSAPSTAPSTATATSSAAASGAASSSTTSVQQTPELLLQTSVGRTTGARTARIFLTESVSGPGNGKVSVTGQGVEDFANRSADLTVAAEGQSLETRLVAGTLYVKLPAGAAGSVNGGKPWLKEATAGLPGLSGSSLSGDPASALSLLASVSDKVTQLGPETVRGTATTRYRLSVDLAKAAAKQGAQAACVFQQERKLLKTTVLPVTVNVDTQGRVRRIALQFDLAATTTAATGGASVTEDFTDFGTPVSVQAPPASQVGTTTLPQASTACAKG